MQKRFLLSMIALLALAGAGAGDEPRHGASGTLAAEPEERQLRVNTRPAAAVARYYRFFRGARKPSLSREAFIQRLAGELVPALPAAHRANGLTGYIQAVAPASAVTGMPDALALVAFESAKAYRRARGTPEGASHETLQWAVFDREQSKTGPARPFRGKVRFDEVQEVVSGPGLDWQSGHTMVFLGARKASMPKVKFLPELTRHVARVRDEMTPAGLDGYILCGTYDHEAAFLHFTDAAACQAALASERGKALLAEAGQLFDILMFVPATPFTGSLAPGQAVNVPIAPPAPVKPKRRRLYE